MTLPRRQPAWTASFAATAEEHLDDVYAYLVYLTRDRSLAEDLAADTFEKALRPGAASTRAAAAPAPGSARSPARPRSTGSAPRSGGGGAKSAPRSRTGSTPASRRASRPSSKPPCASSRAGEREVIALRILLELDGEEAARVLGISPTAVSTRLSRALKKLEEKVSIHV